MRIPQRPSALSGSEFSFGSQDRQAKPLLQYVGVDALVIALLGDGASEEHDALRREGDKNTLHRFDRMALTNVTARKWPICWPNGSCSRAKWWRM